jgi:hypothetical protein
MASEQQYRISYGASFPLPLWQWQRRRPPVPLPACRPQYTEYARMARWLVHQNEWGTVSTISRHLEGAPFGNALSFADGPRCRPTGRLLFYLTSMDATAQDLQHNSTASLTLCEAQLAGACQGIDPEDPTCAKLSITGGSWLPPFLAFVHD